MGYVFESRVVELRLIDRNGDDAVIRRVARVVDDPRNAELGIYVES